MGNQAFKAGEKPPETPKATELAKGKWEEILFNAGVPIEVFGRRHQPCPFCGGRDRFRWKTGELHAQWVCNHCTESHYKSGLEFLARWLRTDLTGAAAYVYRNIGNSVAQPPRVLPSASSTPSYSVAERVAKMQAIWEQARPVREGDAVDLYLRRRVPGLTDIPEDIRCHPGLKYWEASKDRSAPPVLVGTFPAMVVRGFDASGNLVQIHKTYLTKAGEKAPVLNPKKTDVGIGSNSFALRLGWPEAGERLGVSEGIETALSAMVLYNHPVWPCHSASVMERFVVPDELVGQLDRVVIFGDNDARKRMFNGVLVSPGMHAAHNLAKSLRGQGERSLIIRPPRVGMDMADLAVACA